MKIPDWIEAIKLKPLHLAAIFLSGLLLSNKNIAAKFGLASFREQYATWIGLITLLAGVFWVTHSIWFLIKKIKDKFELRKYKKTIIHRINALSLREKVLLFFCVQANSQTITAPLTNPIVHSLCSKGIMRSASGTGSSLNWPSSIEDWIWEYLINNSEIIFSDLLKVDPEQIKNRVREILDPLNY
jgi:hypothetical protein